MSSNTSYHPITRALAWGAISGLRSLLGPAWLSTRLKNQRRNTGLQQKLASPLVHRSLEVLAALEMLADKTSLMPARIAPAALVGRALSGALVGVASAPVAARPLFAGRRGARGLHLVMVGALGAGAAVAAAFAAYHARRVACERFGLSNASAGLIEDGLATLMASRLP